MSDNNLNTEVKENQVEYGSIVERDAGLLEWEHERIIVHRVTFKRMLAIGKKHFSGMWALYCFYFNKARQDETNQPWALDIYCMKGLGWSKNIFYRYKNLLMKHGFIEQIKRRDEKQKFTGFYIKVNSMNKTTSIQCPTNPEGGLSQRVENQDTNALTREFKCFKGSEEKKEGISISRSAHEKVPPFILSQESKKKIKKAINENVYNNDPVVNQFLHSLDLGSRANILDMEAHSCNTIREMLDFIPEYERIKGEDVLNIPGFVWEGLKNDWEPGDYSQWGLEKLQAGGYE